eukprot:9765976-Lingulodinium_polyedra.AAC.1
MEMLEDWAAFRECSRLSTGSRFLATLTSHSPFQTTVVAEMAHLLDSQGLTPEAKRDRAVDTARHMYLGLGQTKCIEDLFKVLRERETGATNNRIIRCTRQWSVAKNSDVMASHARNPVQPLQSEGGQDNQKLPTDLFHTKSFQPSLECASLTQRRSWPSFSPQSQ